MLSHLLQVNTWEDRKQGMDLIIRHITQQNLPPYVFQNDVSKADHLPELKKSPTTLPSDLTSPKRDRSASPPTSSNRHNPSPMKKQRKRIADNNE
jgi:hypothetical protein